MYTHVHNVVVIVGLHKEELDCNVSTVLVFIRPCVA